MNENEIILCARRRLLSDSPTTGGVYFLQLPDGLIKIGKAVNVRRRMADYLTHMFSPPVLLHVCGDIDNDKPVHSLFLSDWVCNELFNPSTDILDYIASAKGLSAYALQPYRKTLLEYYIAHCSASADRSRADVELARSEYARWEAEEDASYAAKVAKADANWSSLALSASRCELEAVEACKIESAALETIERSRQDRYDRIYQASKSAGRAYRSYSRVRPGTKRVPGLPVSILETL